jgi:DNA invertase Pin-like site-specific DNA recombinase
LSTVAEFERKEISERVKDSKAQLRQKIGTRVAQSRLNADADQGPHARQRLLDLSPDRC